MKIKSVYVSYAWEAESTAVVDRLEQVFKEKEIPLQRDSNAIDYGASIRAYMDALAAGQYVIVVLSEKYLKSKNCMYELLEIEKHEKFHKRVFPITLRGAKIYDMAPCL